ANFTIKQPLELPLKEYLFSKSTKPQCNLSQRLCLYSHIFCPNPAGAFAANHACANRFLRCASFQEHGALVVFDFSDDDKVAFAAKQDIFPLLPMDTIF